MTTTNHAELRLELRDERRALRLAPGERVELGRTPPEPLPEDTRFEVITGPLTSRRHARLHHRGDALILSDLGSRNGTLLSGEPITGEVAVGPGHVIEVGDALLTVLSGPEPASAEPSEAVSPPDAVTDASSPPSQPDSDDTSGEAEAPRSWRVASDAALAQSAGGPLPDARVVALIHEREGSAPTLQASDATEVEIGRALSCTFALDDTTLSRQHLALRWRDDAWWASDPGSRRGTYLNGQRLERDTRLDHGDRLDLGRHHAQLIIEGAALRLVIRRHRRMNTLRSGRSATHTLHVETEVASETRRAPSWTPTSDLERPARWPWAVALCLALVAASFAVEQAAPGLGTPVDSAGPGPLAMPHQEAGLGCASCHASDTPGRASEHARGEACTSCHGPHPTTRAGHAKAREEGAMQCADCHRVHRDMAGVELRTDGTWRRWQTGQPETAGALTAFLPTRTQRVALVPLDACVRCHDPGATTDPLQRCIDRARRSDDWSALPALCFNEHQRNGEETTGEVCAAQHDIARPASWAAARELATATPLASGVDGSAPRSSGGWWWALIAILAPLGLALMWRRRGEDAPAEVAGAGSSGATTAPEVLAPPTTRFEPRINELTCLGCSACVDACPYDVLDLEGYVARVVSADRCCGVGACEEKCPNGSLVVAAAGAIEDRLRLSAELAAEDRPGVYVAGDLSGMPLIKNAINQGAHAVQSIAATLPSGHGCDVDVAIIGSGPAGLSAALAAKDAGLRCRIIDQAEVAQSIQSFPRGKLVFDQPMTLPVIGDLWLEEATKEELLAKWLRVIEDEGVEVETWTRLVDLQDRPGGGFDVHTEDSAQDPPEARPVWSAARVVLAVGRRGSPRQLDAPIPPEALGRVHYSLADAASFAGQRCVVVGLGDVAMETAQALALQPGTSVVISYRRGGFHSGSRRNQEAIAELERAGLIRILWESEVEGVERGQVQLSAPEGPIALRCDALFVMIGGVPPNALLARLGLRSASPEAELAA